MKIKNPEKTENKILENFKSSQQFHSLDDWQKGKVSDCVFFDIMWDNYPKDIPIPSISIHNSMFVEICWDNDSSPSISIYGIYQNEMNLLIGDCRKRYNMLLKSDWREIFSKIRETYETLS